MRGLLLGSCLPCGEADAELLKEGARTGPRAGTQALLPPAAVKEREDRNAIQEIITTLQTVKTGAQVQ